MLRVSDTSRSVKSMGNNINKHVFGTCMQCQNKVLDPYTVKA